MFGFHKSLEGKTYHTVGLIAARYRKHPRTIRRWLADPRVGFPPPDLTIHDRAYWADATLDKFDEQRRALAGTADSAAA